MLWVGGLFGGRQRLGESDGLVFAQRSDDCIPKSESGAICKIFEGEEAFNCFADCA